MLALNASAAALFVPAGLAAGDQALLFRELMPGTWLSFAELGFIAYVAWSVHLLENPGARWHRDFWGLCGVFFLVFAIDEITQATLFAGKFLSQSLDLAPARGFNDVDSVILTLGFAGAALVLLPRALVLLRHPLTLALLAVAGLLGAASQGLDSFVEASRWEFVAEESLKMGAEAFFIGAFLVALRDVRQSPKRPSPRGAAAQARASR
jgi:hypothetical protein